MRANLVLTLIGDDRPGLVEAVSDAVAAHGGNWEESRMAHLAGKFAGLLRVTLPSDAQESLERALAGLGERGLRIVVEHAGTELAPAPGSLQRCRLELTGGDHEGIVRDLSRALAAREVNVEELATSGEDAPMGGGRLFKAHALLGLPKGVSIEDLRSAVEDLADDLMVDVSVDEFTE